MSLRKLLKAKPEDVRVDKDKDTLVCIREGIRTKRVIPNPVIINGKVYTKKNIGVGEPHIVGGLIGGEGDYWEEYDSYKEVLLPIFNGDLVPEDDRKRIKDNIEMQIQYAKEHPETVMSMGDNPGGKKVVWLSEYEAEERLQDLQDKYDNIHIEVCYSSGNLMPYAEHLVLSCRVPAEVWEHIKHCFRYIDTSKINDEVWGGVFRGYEIIKDKVDELENLLEIPEHLRFSKLQEEAKKLEEETKQKELEKEQFIEKIKKEFSNENTIPHGIPEGVKIWLEGDKIPFRNMDTVIYGGGEWFIVQSDAIWRVINNGADGDDWSYNNISTGGAGAIGKKFEKTSYRMELLNKLKEMAPNGF